MSVRVRIQCAVECVATAFSYQLSAIRSAQGSRTILWACCKGRPFCLAARRSSLIAASKKTRRLGNTLPTVTANVQPGLIKVHEAQGSMCEGL